MQKKYVLGKRFATMRFLCVLAELLVIVIFYFIYRALFGTAMPGLVGAPLAALFASVAILVMWVTVLFLRRYSETFWYEVTGDGLRMSRGRVVRFYPWKDFKAAKLDHFKTRAMMPVVFETAAGPLTLDQSIEHVYELTLDVLRHIQGSADLSTELRDRLHMVDVMKKKT